MFLEYVLSCRILFCLFVIYRINYIGWERKTELICLLSFTCNYVVSVRRGWGPFLLGARVGLRYFIVALPGPSI